MNNVGYFKKYTLLALVLSFMFYGINVETNLFQKVIGVHLSLMQGKHGIFMFITVQR